MINVHQLIAEDPGFMAYHHLVMAELTGCKTQDEWIYELWKAYQQQVSVTEFIDELLEGRK